MLLLTNLQNVLSAVALAAITAIPLFFLFRLLFKTLKIKQRRKRNILSVLATVITIPGLYLGLLATVIMNLPDPGFDKIPFDKERWEDDPTERYRMVDYMIDKDVLTGKTRAQVIDLLGEEFTNYNDDHIAYYIGVIPGFVPDPCVMDVFLKNGKVKRIAVRGT